MSSRMENNVVLITGGNAGIGLTLAERLLDEDPSIQLCLACRNKKRAEAAREKLLSTYPGVQVDIVIIDVGSLASVHQAAQEIRNRYKRLDYLYLNAGIMPGVQFNWKGLWNGFLSQPIHTLRTAQGMLSQTNRTNEDGLKEVFATNLFGHFVLLRRLEDKLGGPEGTTQIVWTSSVNANKNLFNLSDIQDTCGEEPYSTSKYCVDLLSVELNRRFNEKGVYSHSTCPGFVMTGMTFGILPSWIFTMLLPVLLLERLFVSSMNIFPFNGAEVLKWLYKQKPEDLDPLSKYHSNTSFLGTRYVTTSMMDVEPKLAEQLYLKLEELLEEVPLKRATSSSTRPDDEKPANLVS